MRKVIAIVILLFSIYSCSTKTATTNYGEVELLSANEIVDKMNERNTKPEYLSANLKVKYSTKDNQLNFNAQLRVKTDSAIWMNVSFLGISFVRAVIDNKGVKMFDRQNKRYFDGDFAYISNVLGVDLNYEQLQALLFGMSLQEIKGKDFDSEIQRNSFILEYEKNKRLARRAVNNGDYIKRFWVNPVNFDIERQIIALPDRSNTLIVENSDFELVDKKYKIPGLINLQIVNESVTLLEVEYKGIKTEKINSFPFRIPSTYQEIKLNQARK